jgi:hypothetical protein
MKLQVHWFIGLLALKSLLQHNDMSSSPFIIIKSANCYLYVVHCYTKQTEEVDGIHKFLLR